MAAGPAEARLAPAAEVVGWTAVELRSMRLHKALAVASIRDRDTMAHTRCAELVPCHAHSYTAEISC